MQRSRAYLGQWLAYGLNAAGTDQWLRTDDSAPTIRKHARLVGCGGGKEANHRRWI